MATSVKNETPEKIDDALSQIGQSLDERTNPNKSERVEIDVNGTKLQVKAEPLTEKVAEELTTDDDLGGVIHADVDSPDEAISCAPPDIQRRALQ